MKITSLAGAYCGAITYFVQEGNFAVVIDPAVPPSQFELIHGSPLPPVCAILLTHGHFDHILALDAWRQATGAPVYVHEKDARCLTDPRYSCFAQFLGEDRRFAPAEFCVQDGEELSLGIPVRVIHTPGHTEGSVTYLIGGALFTGDTLFADGGIGRTDLPSGNYSAILLSLSRLFERDGRTEVYPGHGPATTLAAEAGYHRGY